MDEGRKVYTTIDLFKIIAAILVVFLHANTTKTSSFFNLFNSAFTAFCVPFFFLVSGYFFEDRLQKASDQKHFFWKYEKKILGLYAGWALLSLPGSVIFYFEKYSEKSLFYIILIILRRYLLCGQGVYWYILITAESAVIIYFLHKFRKEKYLWGLIVIGLILGFLYDNDTYFSNSLVTTFRSLVYHVFSWSNNFIMKGIPFMGIGYFASKYKNNMTRIPLAIYIAAFILATSLNVLLYNAGLNLTLFFIVQAIAYFAVSILYQIKNDISKSIIIRELSSCIYFLHTFFLYYVIEKVWEKNLFIPLKVSLALLMCITVYLIVKMINKKYNLRVINFLFNIKD